MVVVLGHVAELIRSRVDFGARQVGRSPTTGRRGQAASLRAGLRAVDVADAVVITLGDQPFITPQVIARRSGSSTGYDAVRAVYDGQPGASGRASAGGDRGGGRAAGDVGARDLLARFNVSRWDAPSSGGRR